MRDKIDQYLEERDLSAIMMDGYDEAIVGISYEICTVYEDRSWVKVIYDYNKCIECLMEELTEEQAVEYFEFNTERSLYYIEEYKRPIIILKGFEYD